MKHNWKLAYMDTAARFAEESYAVRLKVGSVTVKDDRIISIGINGTPSGWENVCEDKVYMSVDAGGVLDPEQIQRDFPYEDDKGRYKLVTKDEVLHSEANNLSKLAKSNESAEGAALFVTHSPCASCAKMIFQAGIKEVYYRTEYRTTDGIDFLKKCGITVEQV